MNVKEIKLEDINNYIGSVIWFEKDGRKSKQRTLSKCVDGLPVIFDLQTNNPLFVCFTKENIQGTKIYTYA